jgi:hypothetical protein
MSLCMGAIFQTKFLSESKFLQYTELVKQPRTQGFLLPRLDGQRKRPWLRLVCFAT